MDEADRCDELLLLRDGELLATGTPAELRARTGRATSTTRSCGSSRRRHERHASRSRRRPACSRSCAATRGRSRSSSSCRACSRRCSRFLSTRSRSVFHRVGGAAPRALPVHDDVHRHVDHDAARAGDGTLERLMTLPLAKLDLLARLRDRVRAAWRSSRPPPSRCVAFELLDLHVAGSHVAVVAARGRQRPARHGARAVRERVRADGVPGGAVHAGDRLPADPPLRALRRARADGGWLRADLGCVPAHVRVRRACACDAGPRPRAWFAFDLVVTIGATLLALALGAATLRRRTA